jgi:hypothetical protein
VCTDDHHPSAVGAIHRPYDSAGGIVIVSIHLSVVGHERTLHGVSLFRQIDTFCGSRLNSVAIIIANVPSVLFVDKDTRRTVTQANGVHNLSRIRIPLSIGRKVWLIEVYTYRVSV